ncbi:Secretory pathway Sec39 [Penicillium expansum]|uniref:Secretory pathway Sec39 n=1 Tax=Penicillium expansum TaxID=27334 RepID=A0A0A2JF27_PENEN|nr:Secretory pathway Sec39 [Penicillium expansum]KGO36427.1 Secretory pathway Sec39 [Penicillium expansum]KGO50925.1 Secretory pathway Sec39 [Penicillium expansum]KGO63780.1 Secretory pathway Sec39 [Penicillium expansum]
MALEELSDAHAILLATQFCAAGNVADLPILKARFPHCLPLERLLRIILTFLPESTEPSQYTSVLQELANSSNLPSDRSIDTSAVRDLSESLARKRVRKLHLRPLQRPDEEDEIASADPLTKFLIHRAHLIDSETALQPLILELILPFYENSLIIRTWLISSLLPLLRLNYEFYAHRDETISLEILESMDDQTAVNILLSLMSSEGSNMDLVNNLRGLIGPWLYGGNRSKRRRLNEAAQQSSVSFIEGSEKPQATELAGWEHVNEWLLSRSLVDRDSVVSAYTHWDGPSDVDLGGYDNAGTQLSEQQVRDLQVRYGQSGLAVVYAHADSSMAVLEGSFQVLMRVAKLLDLEDSLYLISDSELPSVHYDTESICSTSRASLLQNSLLRPTNPLTIPSPPSISFLSALLLSLRILTELGHLVPCRVVANMCLHSTEEMQLAELKNVVNSTVKQPSVNQDWSMVRQRLLWLRDWQAEQSDNAWDEPSPYHGLFWRIPCDTVETEILKALLAAKEYQLAIDIYTNSKLAPLNPAQVEAAVQEAIFTAYDNASNGNRTRGGMKRAYDILQSFTSHFPKSVVFKQIHALIAATHALSYYSLTLEHGVPFQPVSIRVHHDPILLIEKVLEQNAKSYTKLDDLLSIGRNLVAAGVPTQAASHKAEDEPPRHKPPKEHAILTAERRITSLAIASALSANDFGTAYSYILTRLTPPSLLSTSSPLLNTTSVPDDITWRAVYNAGRYRATTPTHPPPTLQSQISHLSQRMELLSLALVLVPSPDPLPEILGAWRRCDEELTSLRAREQQEEDLWDRKGDTLTSVPGGFGPSDSERDAFDTEQQRAARRARAAMPNSHRHEAPMGLFEVARGAALALHKNAFPLRGAADSSAPLATRDDDRPLSPDSEGRVRKRDMVSNMMTGGLVSGIGWVLGADPVSKK